jgi:predicted  nucleic acid-binding Zn-ribbon protein
MSDIDATLIRHERRISTLERDSGTQRAMAPARDRRLADAVEQATAIRGVRDQVQQHQATIAELRARLDVVEQQLAEARAHPALSVPLLAEHPTPEHHG